MKCTLPAWISSVTVEKFVRIPACVMTGFLSFYVQTYHLRNPRRNRGKPLRLPIRSNGFMVGNTRTNRFSPLACREILYLESKNKTPTHRTTMSKRITFEINGPTEKLSINLPKHIYDYFFAKPHSVFCATHGIRQPLTSILYEKLYEAARTAGIPPEWHPDNEERILVILSQMNFSKKKPKPTPPNGPASL